MDQCHFITNVLDRSHVVRGENHGVAFFFQCQDFAFQQLCIDGVETGERFVKNEQRGFVQHCDDKLHLLLHTLGEFFQLLVPPRHDVEAFKPLVQALFGLLRGKPFEAGQIHRLLAHFHLLVEAAFLGQIADASHIFRRKVVSVEHHMPTVGSGDAIEDAYECGLAGTVGSEQTKNLAAWHFDAHIVECRMLGIAFHYVRCRKECFRIVHILDVLLLIKLARSSPRITLDINS